MYVRDLCVRTRTRGPLAATAQPTLTSNLRPRPEVQGLVRGGRAGTQLREDTGQPTQAGRSPKNRLLETRGGIVPQNPRFPPFTARRTADQHSAGCVSAGFFCSNCKQEKKKKKKSPLEPPVLLELFLFLLTISEKVPELAGVNVLVDLDETRFIELEGLWELLGQVPHALQELSEHG